MKGYLLPAILGGLVTAAIAGVLTLTGTFSEILITDQIKKKILRDLPQNPDLIRAVSEHMQSDGELIIDSLFVNSITVGEDKVIIGYDARGGNLIVNKSDGEKAAMILVEDRGRGGTFRAWDYASTKHIDVEAVNNIRIKDGK